MQWSKTKTTLEGFLCDKLKGRIQIHATVYRKFHDSPGRVWIIFDKKEIITASDVTYTTQYEKLYKQTKENKKLTSIPYDENWENMFNSVEREELIKASDEVETTLVNQNIFESFHFYESFMKYATLSIEEAMTSENVIIKAYSMFDRRLGKRRIEKLAVNQEVHSLIRKFYQIRCEVEGIHEYETVSDGT
ncbi:SF0329 family protein [Paucisalibacillus globulus]|uniref:SF0329 family protein n=1 Tax=Paucisalibacillus globulus TaxID=351095 RepID=UPI0003FE95E4|nr:hypothetical protein [Paucisalibacillus globulus]